MQDPLKEKEPLTVAAIRTAHVKQLQWALKFIRQNLGELRAGEWLSLKENLYDFTLVAQRFPSTKRSDLYVAIEKHDEERFIQEVSPHVVQDIQSRLIQFSQALVTGGAHVSMGWGVCQAAFDFSCSSLSSPFVLGFGIQSNVEAATIAMGLHLVGSMLTKEQFLRCPECGTIFISIRKPRPDRQLHCSLRCSRNAASRRHREKLQSQQRERARAKRRYEKKIREKYGPKTRVAKRRSSTTAQTGQ